MVGRYGSVRPWLEQSANARGLTATEWVLSEVKYGSTLLRAARGMEPKRAWVGPSLFGMSACGTVHSGVSIATASANGKSSRDVCYYVAVDPVGVATRFLPARLTKRSSMLSPRNLGATTDELVLLVSRRLGYRSTSAQLRAGIEDRVAVLVGSKRLASNGSMITPC